VNEAAAARLEEVSDGEGVDGCVESCCSLVVSQS